MCEKKAGDPNFLYYIFVLLCVLHVILENKKNIISTTYIILLFSAHTSDKYMFEKMEKTRLSHGNAHFQFAKIPYFLICNNMIRICIKVFVKKVYQRLQNFDCFSYF